MRHPCAEHMASCDHCSICEAGVCCGSVSAAQRIQLEAEYRRPYSGLASAIVCEAGTAPMLRDLVSRDAERRQGGLLLPTPRSLLPPVLADPNRLSDSRKEATHVVVSRTAR